MSLIEIKDVRQMTNESGTEYIMSYEGYEFSVSKYDTGFKVLDFVNINNMFFEDKKKEKEIQELIVKLFK